VTDLVGADPFPLDRPGAKALVVGVVAGEVAVLDQAAAGVPTGEVDDFELSRKVSEVVHLFFSVGRNRRQMVREAKSETERRKNQGERDAYLTHGCGFADGREDLRFRDSLPLVWNTSYFLGEFFSLSFLVWKSAVC
jgi:hypothetical protein